MLAPAALRPVLVAAGAGASGDVAAGLAVRLAHAEFAAVAPSWLVVGTSYDARTSAVGSSLLVAVVEAHQALVPRSSTSCFGCPGQWESVVETGHQE